MVLAMAMVGNDLKASLLQHGEVTQSASQTTQNPVAGARLFARIEHGRVVSPADLGARIEAVRPWWFRFPTPSATHSRVRAEKAMVR
jgi:hypothetical protein